MHRLFILATLDLQFPVRIVLNRSTGMLHLMIMVISVKVRLVHRNVCSPRIEAAMDEMSGKV